MVGLLIHYFLLLFHFSDLFLTNDSEINSLHKVHANVNVLQTNKCVYIMKKKITIECTIAKKGIDIETIPQGNKRIKYYGCVLRHIITHINIISEESSVNVKHKSYIGIKYASTIITAL